MKKNVIAITIAAVIVAGALALWLLGGKNHAEKKENASTVTPTQAVETEYLTKKQWMECLDSVLTGTSQYYDEKQADEAADAQFVKMTSMERIGKTRLGIFLKANGENVPEAENDLYLEAGNYWTNSKLADATAKITANDKNGLAEEFRKLYEETFWVDSFYETTYQENLKVFGDDEVKFYHDALTLYGDAENCKVGDIIGYTDPATGYPTVGKIINVGPNADEKIRATITKDIEVDEILLNAEGMACEGISLDKMYLPGYTKKDGSPQAQPMRGFPGNFRAQPMGLKDGISYEGFEIHVSCEDGESQVEITDKGTGIVYVSPFFGFSNKQSKYDVTLDVSDVYTRACWEYKHAEGGFQYAEVEFHQNVTVKSQVGDAQFADKKFKLFDSAVPIADGLLWVEFEFYLVFNAEGEVSIEIQTPMNMHNIWTKDGGTRAVEKNGDTPVVTIHGEVTGNFFVRGEVVLALFYLYDLIDAEADCGVTAKVETNIRSNGLTCVEMKLAYPTFSISVNGDKNDNDICRSLLGRLAGSATFTIFDDENALFQKVIHLEKRGDEKAKRVEECTYEKMLEGHSDGDLSFLYGGVRTVWFEAKKINTGVNTITDQFGEEIEDYYGDWDIEDTGEGYRINVSRLTYRLAIGRDEFDAFIQNAIEADGTVEVDRNGDSLNIYKIIEENAEITVMGEKFRLIYCKDRSNWRGYICTFEDEYGEKYGLASNLLPEGDDYDRFTQAGSWVLAQGNSIAVREYVFHDTAYITIPYEMAKESNLELYVKESPDFDNAHPGGTFAIQFAEDGNVLRFRELEVGNVG